MLPFDGYPSDGAIDTAARRADAGPPLAVEPPAASGAGATNFRSVLTPSSDGDDAAETSEAPAFFVDLNLDQIVASVTLGKQEYNVAPFFHRPLRTVEAIEYRQDVMRDLADECRFDTVSRFAISIKSVRDHVAQAGKLHYKYQKDAWLLDAVELYCDAVQRLLSELRGSEPRSAGLVGFITFLDAYVASPAFQGLLGDIASLRMKLAFVRYNLLIGGGFVTVSAHGGETDYGAEIQADFEKFRQGVAADHVFKFGDFPQMNHIEAGVLERVARLFPETFAELDAFVARNVDFFDSTVRRFDREVQFYLAYIAHMRAIRAASLAFCYPTVSMQSKDIRVSECYDLALANTLLGKPLSIVTNDFHLDEPERVIIVSGPNQGGKTTFARTFGQLHYLASLGCPVPAATAQLFLFDRLFTHFEKSEVVNNLRGKLHDDLTRLHKTLSEATSDSVIILNEVFNSTSLEDAVFLGASLRVPVPGAAEAGLRFSRRHHSLSQILPFVRRRLARGRSSAPSSPLMSDAMLI